MIYLIGLGLGWKDLSMKALEAINKSDEVYIETYTSLSDFTIQKLSKLIGKKIIPLDRKAFEEKQPYFKQAHLKDIAILIYGDPLSATTHTELLLDVKKTRAKRNLAGYRKSHAFSREKFKVEIIHAPSIMTAIAETGLFLYKFGKTASIPLPQKGFKPESFYDLLKENQSIKAHTLFLLDLKPDQKKFMTIPNAIKTLVSISEKRKDGLLKPRTKFVACARLGTDSQKIKAGTANKLSNIDWGKPPYCLIIPAELNFKEQDFIEQNLAR